MDVGPRYNVGSSNPSKLFGSMLLLIFSCGNYLRSGKSIAVTDSACGFIDAMIFLPLWGISWVTSLRVRQQRGFLGVNEFLEALKKKHEKNQIRKNEGFTRYA